MRSFDLASLYRATIGFDQIADMMDRVSAHDVKQSSYPPYSIEKKPPKMGTAFRLLWPAFWRLISAL